MNCAEYIIWLIFLLFLPSLSSFSLLCSPLSVLLKQPFPLRASFFSLPLSYIPSPLLRYLSLSLLFNDSLVYTIACLFVSLRRCPSFHLISDYTDSCLSAAVVVTSAMAFSLFGNRESASYAKYFNIRWVDSLSLCRLQLRIIGTHCWLCNRLAWTKIILSSVEANMKPPAPILPVVFCCVCQNPSLSNTSGYI